MDRIAVIGIAQTKYQKNMSGNFGELIYDVTNKVMEDADVTLEDIDNVVSVSSDFWDGRTISCMAICDASGSYDKDITCVEGDGTYGALYGMMRIMSGSFGTTLVVAHHKGTESNMSGISNTCFDPLIDRKLGIDSLASHAMQARRYMAKHAVSEEEIATVSVKNHGNAKRNPLAMLPMDITVQDVMESKMMASPLKKLDCSAPTDGACAMLLASEHKAKKLSTNKKRVWLKGVGHMADAYMLGDRDLADTSVLKEAASKAYKIAGVGPDDIDVAEVYDAFDYMELMWLEGLGFCGDGNAAEDALRGRFDFDGDLPVNPSGGRLSANPLMVAGLASMAECVLQIRGEAGEHQVDGARTAVAHGINGMCGQSHCVWVLGK